MSPRVFQQSVLSCHRLRTSLVLVFPLLYMPEEKMAKVSEGNTRVNMERSTAWAIGAFKQWLEEHYQ